MDKLKPLQNGKAKRIQHHQKRFTKNAKGTSLGRKHKRRKSLTITNPKQLRMVIGTYIWITILNVNGLNAPNKIQRRLNGYKNKTCIYVFYKRPTSDLGTPTD